MKRWVIAIGVLVGLPLLFFASIYVASELGGEVVVLHRPAADGSVDRVRVWIVDDDGGVWIEHGDPEASWIQGLAQAPELTVERAGAAAIWRATPDAASHAHYHELRQAKYGWADSYVALVTSDAASCPGVPIRLDPIGS